MQADLLPVEGERDFEMEAELKLLFVAVGRCSERLIFAETKESKATSDMFRWLQQEDLAVAYRPEDHANHGDVRRQHLLNLAELVPGLDDCTAEKRAQRLEQIAKICRVAGYTNLEKRAMAQLQAETIESKVKGDVRRDGLDRIRFEDMAVPVKKCIMTGLVTPAEKLLRLRVEAMELDVSNRLQQGIARMKQLRLSTQDEKDEAWVGYTREECMSILTTTFLMFTRNVCKAVWESSAFDVIRGIVDLDDDHLDPSPFQVEKGTVQICLHRFLTFMRRSVSDKRSVIIGLPPWWPSEFKDKSGRLSPAVRNLLELIQGNQRSNHFIHRRWMCKYLIDIWNLHNKLMWEELRSNRPVCLSNGTLLGDPNGLIPAPGMILDRDSWKGVVCNPSLTNSLFLSSFCSFLPHSFFFSFRSLLFLTYQGCSYPPSFVPCRTG